MSTAASFKHIRPFPFCPGNINATVGNIAFVPNISLASAMAFAWNIENLTITRTGTATKGAVTADGTGTFTLNPISDTKYEKGGGSGMWFPLTASNTFWASWPAIKAPRERVCFDTSSNGQLLFLTAYQTSSSFSQLFFYVGTDPINTGMYQIHYGFGFSVQETSGGSSASIFFNDAFTGIGSATPITTGNISVGGINLAYASGYVGDSYTGGTMSASSSYYTY